jgi:hypothetical protein
MLNGLRSAMGKLKSVEELFKGRHCDREIVILCVRWYLRFKLSLRDLGCVGHLVGGAIMRQHHAPPCTWALCRAFA